MIIITAIYTASENATDKVDRYIALSVDNQLLKYNCVGYFDMIKIERRHRNTW